MASTKVLSKLTELKYLSLEGLAINDISFTDKLSKLKFLDIANTDVNDEKRIKSFGESDMKVRIKGCQLYKYVIDEDIRESCVNIKIDGINIGELYTTYFGYIRNDADDYNFTYDE